MLLWFNLLEDVFLNLIIFCSSNIYGKQRILKFIIIILLKSLWWLSISVVCKQIKTPTTAKVELIFWTHTVPVVQSTF